MHLRSDLDEALFSYISSALDKAALDLHSRDQVQSVIRAVISVTQDAIAGFKERWNARAAPRLPPEVLSGCFEWLPFNGRLAVSHVSRHWRRVALGTPVLWSTFATGGDMKKMHEMIRRSQAAPLSVGLSFHDYAEREALRPHTWRVTELTSYWLLGDLDTPCLERLKVKRAHTDIELTGESIRHSAQSLRALELYCEGFSLAPCCPPFVNLREFKGKVTLATDFARLFQLCPALEVLDLVCIDHLLRDITPLFAPIPASLSTISVTGISPEQGTDHDAVAAWKGHLFRSLEFQILSDISGIVGLFASSVNSGWRMDISTVGQCVSHTLSTHMAKTFVRGYGNVGPFRMGPLAAENMRLYQMHLHHLVALRLPLSFFSFFISEGIVLPAVTEFTLEDDCIPGYTSDVDTIPADDCGGPGILTPLLCSFAFVRLRGWSMCKEAVEWFIQKLPQFLRVWMRYEADVLERITLAVDVSPGELNDAGFHQSAIHAMAKLVLVHCGDENSS